jgi:hypothetical protein
VEDVVGKLLQEGLLDADSAQQVRDAIAAGKSLDEALRLPKGASEEKILRFLGGYFDIPFLDLEKDGEKYAMSFAWQRVWKFIRRSLRWLRSSGLPRNTWASAPTRCNRWAWKGTTT